MGSDFMNHNYNQSNNSTPPFSMNDQRVQSNSMFQENISFDLFKKNIGKLGTFYMSFPSSNEVAEKSFKGVLESFGKDYILISDPTSGKWYMLVSVYLNYIEFEEEVNK